MASCKVSSEDRGQAASPASAREQWGSGLSCSCKSGCPRNPTPRSLMGYRGVEAETMPAGNSHAPCSLWVPSVPPLTEPS